MSNETIESEIMATSPFSSRVNPISSDSLPSQRVTMTIQSTAGHNHKVSSTRTRKYAADNRTFITEHENGSDIMTQIGREILIAVGCGGFSSHSLKKKEKYNVCNTSVGPTYNKRNMNQNDIFLDENVTNIGMYSFVVSLIYLQ